QNAMNRIELTLPERSYQDVVVTMIGALDDKIAVNERIAATSVQLADAHFIAAVAGGCNESETFGSIASVHGGGTPRTSESSYWDGDIPWATPSDVTALSSPYLFSTGRRITDDGLANCASQLYPAGS